PFSKHFWVNLIFELTQKCFLIWYFSTIDKVNTVCVGIKQLFIKPVHCFIQVHSSVSSRENGTHIVCIFVANLYFLPCVINRFLIHTPTTPRGVKHKLRLLTCSRVFRFLFLVTPVIDVLAYTFCEVFVGLKVEYF